MATEPPTDEEWQYRLLRAMHMRDLQLAIKQDKKGGIAAADRMVAALEVQADALYRMALELDRGIRRDGLAVLENREGIPEYAAQSARVELAQEELLGLPFFPLVALQAFAGICRKSPMVDALPWVGTPEELREGCMDALDAADAIRAAAAKVLDLVRAKSAGGAGDGGRLPSIWMMELLDWVVARQVSLRSVALRLVRFELRVDSTRYRRPFIDSTERYRGEAVLVDGGQFIALLEDEDVAEFASAEDATEAWYSRLRAAMKRHDARFNGD